MTRFVPASDMEAGVMKLDDDELVYWNFNGQHISCRVPELRNALRAAYPDWPDDQIEREIATRLVPKGED